MDGCRRLPTVAYVAVTAAVIASRRAALVALLQDLACLDYVRDHVASTGPECLERSRLPEDLRRIRQLPGSGGGEIVTRRVETSHKTMRGLD